MIYSTSLNEVHYITSINHLSYRMRGADSARDDTVDEGTTFQSQKSWSRWILFCVQVRIADALLIDFEVKEQYRLVGDFCQAMRVGSFSFERYTELKLGTCHATVDHVAHPYWSMDRPNPRCENTGDIAFLLQRQ
jgi:hypothetical protein